MKANITKAADSPYLDGLWRAGLRAGIAAAALNALLYLAGYPLGILEGLHLVGSAAARPGVLTIAALSVGTALGGTALFALLTERLRHPMPVFVAAATPLFLLSILVPTAMLTWPRSQVVLFQVMHIVVATAIGTALWNWQRART